MDKNQGVILRGKHSQKGTSAICDITQGCFSELFHHTDVLKSGAEERKRKGWNCSYPRTTNSRPSKGQLSKFKRHLEKKMQRKHMKRQQERTWQRLLPPPCEAQKPYLGL